MANQENLQLFDLRTVRRNVARGRTEQSEYQTYLDALPDLSEKIKAPDEGGDDDGYEVRSTKQPGEDAGPAHPVDEVASDIVPPMPENPAPAPPPPEPPVT